MRQVTLCMLLREGEILLAMKKRRFGVGKWNGVGGKLEGNETLEEGAIREIKEEIGVDVRLEDLDKRGALKFYFPRDREEWNQEVIIYSVRSWQGEPAESEELVPKWFKYQDIPFDQMWSDDKYWLPKFLEGKKLQGEFHFKDDGESFEKFDLREVESIV